MMKTKRGTLLLGMVLGIFVIGLGFASYDYFSKIVNPNTKYQLIDSSKRRLTAAMRDNVIKAIEDIDKRLIAIENKPEPIHGECGRTELTCTKGKPRAEVVTTHGNLIEYTRTCLGQFGGADSKLCKATTMEAVSIKPIGPFNPIKPAPNPNGELLPNSGGLMVDTPIIDTNPKKWKLF